MTSDEIKDLQDAAEASGIDTPEKTKIIALFEIAAQLAELNEHLRRVDESVFGAPKNEKSKEVEIRKT